MDELRIVVAEDNPELRKLLADGLERVGFVVVQAENGADLLTKFDVGVALIVTDVRMPSMDGITAIEVLRNRGIATPVIFMTAYGDLRSRNAAEKLNSRWIDKPIGLVGLRAAVADVLGLAPSG